MRTGKLCALWKTLDHLFIGVNEGLWWAKTPCPCKVL